MNQPLWDRWSLIHASSGALLTLGLWALDLAWYSVLIVFGIETVWEIIENNWPGIWLWNKFGYDYAGDSHSHTIFDIIVTVAGSAGAALSIDLAGFAIGSVITGSVTAVMLVIFYAYLLKQRKSLQVTNNNEIQGLVF